MTPKDTHALDRLLQEFSLPVIWRAAIRATFARIRFTRRPALSGVEADAMSNRWRRASEMQEPRREEPNLTAPVELSEAESDTEEVLPSASDRNSRRRAA